MKLTKYALLIAIIVVSMICQSCGGNSNTSGTLTITAPASVAAGDSFQVSVVYTNTNATADSTTLQGLPVTFTAMNGSTLVSSGTASTDQSGKATVQLATTNNIAGDQTVVVTAQTGGLTQSASFTLKANQLTIVSPGTLTGTFPAGTISGIAPSGTFITYKDGNGNSLPNQTVSISVISLTPVQSVDTNVYWMNTGTPTAFTLGVPITVTTDSNGVIDLSSFYVTSLVPPAGDSTSVVVHFQAEVNIVPGVPGVNIITDSTSYAFTFTGK